MLETRSPTFERAGVCDEELGMWIVGLRNDGAATTILVGFPEGGVDHERRGGWGDSMLHEFITEVDGQPVTVKREQGLRPDKVPGTMNTQPGSPGRLPSKLAGLARSRIPMVKNIYDALILALVACAFAFWQRRKLNN